MAIYHFSLGKERKREGSTKLLTSYSLHRGNAMSHLVNVYWSPIPLSLPLPFPGGNSQPDLNTYDHQKCTVNNLIVQNFHSTVLVPLIHSDDTIKMSTHLLVAHAAFKIFLSDTILR